MHEYVVDEVYLDHLLFYKCPCTKYLVPTTGNSTVYFCKSCERMFPMTDDNLCVKYKLIKMYVNDVATGETRTVRLSAPVIERLFGVPANEFNKRYAEDLDLLKKIRGSLKYQYCSLEFAHKKRDDNDEKVIAIKLKLGENFTNVLEHIKFVFAPNRKLATNPYC